MGRAVKRQSPVNPVVELLDLVSPRVTEDGEDPSVFTRKELEDVWKMTERKVLETLRQLAALDKVEPVMAKRKGLHGIISVKAYRLKP